MLARSRPAPADVTELDAAASPRVRRALHVFLLLFALCGLAHIEAWPLTGFRLFSEARTAEREGFEIVAVDAAGAERPIDLHDLPAGFQGTTREIPGLLHADPRRRDRACDAWAAPERARGRTIVEVRVYEVVESVRPGGPPAQRTLAFRCGRH
jgi:hypothetical protein